MSTEQAEKDSQQKEESVAKRQKLDFDPNEPKTDALHKLASGVWSYCTEFLFEMWDFKMPMFNRCLIVHIPEKEALAVINPSELKEDVLDSILSLQDELSAKIKYLLSPNDWHWMFMEQYLKYFPEATAYIPPGRIVAQNPSFKFVEYDMKKDNPLPELAPALVIQNMKGLQSAEENSSGERYELIYYIQAAEAIASADLLWFHKAGTIAPIFQTFGHRENVLEFHFQGFKVVKDSEALLNSFEAILALNFDRFISLHGPPGTIQAEGSKTELKKLVEWLKAGPPLSSDSK